MAGGHLPLLLKGRLAPRCHPSAARLGPFLALRPLTSLIYPRLAHRNARSYSTIPNENPGVAAETDAKGIKVKDWENNLDRRLEGFDDLPDRNFGLNQHIPFDAEFKEALKQVPWQFRAPIRYAFAYGSGVFPQSESKGKVPTDEELRAIHPNAPAAIRRHQDGTPKMIDFIFGVSHTQHWHSLNMKQHRSHYSALASLGSGAVSYVQDKWGAGVYFNPYVVVNGILIKYGVVQLNTLEQDLTQWDTLYLAGRLQKPVKILRDDPQIRLANQMNLISALRTALLLLPPRFTEEELYSTIAGISYLGDPRMALPTENPSKVKNIVGNNMANFRRLYMPLIETLPNVEYNDPGCNEKDWVWGGQSMKLVQDMDPIKRGNMVRRLPKAFRSRLYFQYQKKFAIPQLEFDQMMHESKTEDSVSFKRQEGGGFEQRIAQDGTEELQKYIRTVIKQTISWPATTQSLKGPITSGLSKTWRYLAEKRDKYRVGRAAEAAADAAGAAGAADAAKADKAETKDEEKK
ncbi:mitochondrial matrix Mmp37-domain-containing protein [Lasiosphaeris hirsuta]|uniref:Phosphatidate cytidylyltransferase, mitochondrial n=1 Tax=Lasiosphaeris hirsuta TaxID=260670 RepID=A0AA40AGU9_9PEZI|nr:mitochondrial matrix Mmp37-domain-containing protein [Lasiosphaeris hirsuta]